MLNGALVETVSARLSLLRRRGEGRCRSIGRHRHSWSRVAALVALALLAGCATKPKLPPGVTPDASRSGRRSSPTRGRRVATAADEDRLARLGLAWQEALAEAQEDQRRRRPPRRQAAAAAVGAAAAGADAGQLQLPADQARQGDRQGQGVRKLQAVLLLRRGRGRPADDRQADRQPAARRAGCGRTTIRPA